MIYALIAECCSDLPVAVCCRVMKVSTSGYYQRKATPVTDRELTEAHAANVAALRWSALSCASAWAGAARPPRSNAGCAPVALWASTTRRAAGARAAPAVTAQNPTRTW